MKVNIAGVDEYRKNIRTLVVGQARAEKMAFASTAPNVLWASANADKSYLARASMPYVEIDNIQTLFELKLALDRDAESREGLFGFPIDTLVIDSVEELQRILLEEHLRVEGRVETKIEDWGWIGKRFHAIFAAFSELEIDLIVLSDVKDVTIGENEVWVKPALQGAFADQIHRYMDYSFLLRSNLTPEFDITKQFQESWKNVLSLIRGSDQVAADETDEPTDEVVPDEVPEPVRERSTWLTTKPVSYAEWITDSSQTLPAKIELNFEDDYDSILKARSNVDLTESSVTEIDPNPVEAETDSDKEQSDGPAEVEQPEPSTVPETQTDNLVCADCGKVIESSNWVLLADMKGWPPVCKKHYSIRNK